jgi:protease I
MNPQPKEKIMNQNRLNGKKIAILATEGFEQSELEKPREALDAAGATTHIVSPKDGQIRAWAESDFGDTFDVDVKLDDANPDDYDALLLPGGVLNPDKLRLIPDAVQFARSFFAAGKPVAAICHGPQLLIEADVVRGRKMTSYPSVKKDLMNAGAKWVDEPVVVDQGLVTSRKPADIPQFNAKMIEEFAEGEHAGQREAISGGQRSHR